MREVYLEHRNVNSVAHECNVDWKCADRYRVEDNWDEACAKLDRLIEKLTIDKIAKRRTDNIKIAQAAIIKMAKSLDKQSELKFDPYALERLARLVEFLSGDPDSRVDGETTINVNTRTIGVVLELPANGRDANPGPKPNPS